MTRPFASLTASFRTVLFWLLAVDVSFVLIHGIGFLMNRAGLTGKVPPLLRIAEDSSLPEIFNYVKWTIILLALLWLAIRKRWWTPFAWSLVFLLILVDDSFQLHETFGAVIADYGVLPEDFLVQPNDLGELIVFGLMGLSVILLTGFTFTRSGATSRRLSMTYAAIILALGFFGVGVDIVHQAIAYFAEGHPTAELLPHVFALIEDGGEMVVASIATALTLAPPVRLATPAEPGATVAKA